jgi:hypothetical protein
MHRFTHTPSQLVRFATVAVLLQIVFGLFAGECLAQGADTRYVRANAPAGGNGTSWATAYNNIKTAVTAANSNQGIKKIWVAKGTYFPGTTRFTLKNNLAIYGGFAGTETQFGQRDITLNETILTGQGTNGIISGGTTNESAVVDGFTIRDGFASQGNGGAVLNGSGTFRNCRFINNIAEASGGAWYGQTGTPRFIACEFTGNECEAGGAAIETVDGSIVVVGCRFSGNQAPFAAIYSDTGSVTVIDSLIAANSAGGVLANAGPVFIRNSTIVANSGQFLGNTAMRSNGVITIENSIIWENQIVGNFTATYSCLPTAAPGAGNISADPKFVNAQGGDWRLAAGSPAIDAGSVSLLPADAFDLDGDGDVAEKLPNDVLGRPRRFDEPSVADTGIGPAPVVDIGATEYFSDCNGNGTFDATDIANGTSADIDANGVPDECEDCNDNNVPDGLDISSGTSDDCQKDGVPDECQLGFGAPVISRVDDGVAEDSVGNNAVGNFIWLNAFQVEAGGEVLRAVDLAFGSGIPEGETVAVHVWTDPSNDGNPEDAARRVTVTVKAVSPGTSAFTTVDVPDLVLGEAGTWFFVGAQTFNRPFPAPRDFEAPSALQSWISAATTLDDADPDDLAAAGLFGLIDSYGISGNWLIRARSFRDGDCNANGIPDDCDITNGTLADCNGNSIPDGCELATNDCNANGVPDDCDLASGTAKDCNVNGIPDSCEIAQGSESDIDSNGVPDSCEDCNGNSVPDGVDIGSGFSLDCQPDGIPDECQLNGKKPELYSYDDARPEFWVSSDAPNMAWLNNFTIEEGKERIVAIDVMFGLVPEGRPHVIYLWSDPNGDGNPDDAQVLASVNTVAVDVGEAFTYTRIDIADVDLAPGTSFFVGAVTNGFTLFTDVPAPKDSTPPNGKSWLVGRFSAIDPNDLSNNADEFLQIDDLGGAFIGNWCVRAVAESTADCNGNNIPDDCDIADGTSSDANKDGVPDECAPCAADLDGDGDVGSSDLAIVLSGWGTASPLADVNDDGQVDSNDLGVILSGWGSCGKSNS